MEREARRKKIASHETGRMALITGRIHEPDPNIISKSCSFSNPSHHYNYSHGGDHDDMLDTTKIHDTNDEVCKENASENLFSEEVVINGVQSNQANYPEKPFEYHLSSVTPKEINFSIISSENTRVICSFVIVILVVLSHINLPHNVVKSESLIAYRPLYALLLTDTLIVAARLALYSEGKEDEKEVKFEGGGDNWEGAVKLLEWGLVLHQTVRAVFIDCSFYLVIVVCGLSMV